MTAPLSGVRVLEFGHAIAAPHCCQILADHGADVIKVEPIDGDRARQALPIWSGVSLYFAAHNRGKRSLAIDLKQDRARELLLELAATADVLVTNYSPRAARELGITAENLKRANPGLIVVHITGFGQTGRFRDNGAYDGVIQAMSGIPSVTGDAPEPSLVGVFVPDHLAAWQAALSVVLALEQRRRTGLGADIDLSMLDGYFATVAHWVGEVVDEGGEPWPRGNQVRTAFANTFRARDGFVYLAPLGPKAWSGLCEALARPEWVELMGPVAIGERRDELEGAIEEWTLRRTREEVVELLRRHGVPCGPVNTMAEAVNSPEIRSRDMVIAVDFGGQRVHVPGPPVRVGMDDEPGRRRVPSIGQDSRAVLMELGHPQDQIADWEEAGLIAAAKETADA